MPYPTLRQVALVAGIAAAATLFVFAFVPPPRVLHAFVHGLAPHWLLHGAAFAIFTCVWLLALPRVPVLWIAPAILAFGVLHEVVEIAGHGHRFELGDALSNAAGTIAGALAGRAARR